MCLSWCVGLPIPFFRLGPEPVNDNGTLYGIN